jgi:PilZ domain
LPAGFPRPEKSVLVVVASRHVTAVARFRAHARRKVRLRGVIWHPRAGWYREVEIADLGLGGARLQLWETLNAGDRISLSLVAPTLWDPLAIPARIVWVWPATSLDRGSAGVAFEPKDSASMLALFELMGTLDYED